MQGDTRILDLIGILILSFLIWLGFNPSNSLIPSGSVAYSAAETGDQHETESNEKTTGDRDDQQLSGVKTHMEPILLPQKRTTLLKQTQLLGYATYQYYCAVCHGKRGGGNGSNAKNLSIPPRKHNNAPYMANLSDGYLSRVIKEGGASQGLSPLMPPWGGAMGDEEISNLIAFIRILPDSQMMAGLEKNQKSAGMDGHGGHGGGGEDDHGSAEADNHDESGSDDHDASGGDGHHMETTDDHGAATADDSHTAETDDHQEAEVDEHNEATSTDDHMAADAEKPHGMEAVDEPKESSTNNHGTETGDQHEAGSEDNHTD